MRIIEIGAEGGLYETAKAMLKNALLDDEQNVMIRKVIEDPEVDRGALFGTAFAFGASFALCEAKAGRVTHATTAKLLIRIDELETELYRCRRRIQKLEDVLRFTRDVGLNTGKIDKVLGEPR